MTDDPDLPPPGLRQSILAALRREGLIATPPRRFSGLGGALAASLAIGLFALGWFAGRWPGPPPSGQVYALLLYDKRGPALPDAVEADRLAEYGDWGRGLGDEAGVAMISGEKLADAGVVIGPPAKGPGGGVLQGFFLVRAPDDAVAARIARQSPHVAHGGAVELRRVVQTP